MNSRSSKHQRRAVIVHLNWARVYTSSPSSRSYRIAHRLWLVPSVHGQAPFMLGGRLQCSGHHRILRSVHPQHWPEMHSSYKLACNWRVQRGYVSASHLVGCTRFRRHLILHAGRISHFLAPLATDRIHLVLGSSTGSSSLLYTVGLLSRAEAACYGFLLLRHR